VRSHTNTRTHREQQREREREGERGGEEAGEQRGRGREVSEKQNTFTEGGGKRRRDDTHKIDNRIIKIVLVKSVFTMTYV
jgi:hypothetical protein